MVWSSWVRAISISSKTWCLVMPNWWWAPMPQKDMVCWDCLILAKNLDHWRCHHWHGNAWFWRRGLEHVLRMPFWLGWWMQHLCGNIFPSTYKRRQLSLHIYMFLPKEREPNDMSPDTKMSTWHQWHSLQGPADSLGTKFPKPMLLPLSPLAHCSNFVIIPFYGLN